MTIFICKRCSYRQAPKQHELKRTTTKKREDERNLSVVEEDTQALPIVEAECPKCGHTRAYFWTLQTRSADEAETRFFRCVKCKYTWREYD